MSGIEVAGIVLGTFPVAIWALERYREAARVMGFWYEIRLEYQRSSNELKFHRLSFIRNLKQLLLPIVPDDTQLHRLIGDPGGEAWQDPAIQRALEARLQDSYDIYLEILSEMQRVMSDLNQELAIDNDAAQPKARRNGGAKAPTPSRIKQTFDRSSRSYQAFRVKFSLGEQARTRLFTEFQTYNDRLEKLMASSDVVSELEETRQKQQQQASKPAMSAITKFWGTAEKLYRALFEAWSCSCRDHHCAQLELRHRDLRDNDFQLHLDSGTREVPGSSLWSRYQVTVKILGEEPQSIVRMFGRMSIQETSTRISNLTAESNTQRQRKTLNKSVHFGPDPKDKEGLSVEPPTKASLQTKSVTQAVTVVEKQSKLSFRPNPPPSPPPSYYDSPEQPLHIITDLCHTLEADASATPPSKPSPGPLGYLRLEDSDTQFAIHSDFVHQLPLDHCNIDLSSLFMGQSKSPLTRRQRYRLSLVLASSFVQLKDTSWIQGPWDKRTVHFPSTHKGQADLDSPFIISRFRGSHQIASRLPTEGTTPNENDVAGIACLGILLLELCFGRPIEKHPSRLVIPGGGEGEQIRAALDLIAALEWLKEVNDEAGADYTEAVEWCLAGCRTLSRDGGSWRKHMVERVVEPLERCYKYLG
ncbi:hypothetical protein B0T14DRAFT_245057 [Immersiella caudata]|uniref:DUF7580 domain-containing protein n=1 Tax=Immersiella caudata TaxID=314043 RepID=A0AA39WJ34_9PEZI|nr:hypothetical protein B0T14DRAFT_245057 [Immersiella caudata]